MKSTRSGNRKEPRRGSAGQPRAQALGIQAGSDFRPERPVQAASAFPRQYPERPFVQGSYSGMSCSTLSGSARVWFHVCEDACCFPRACALGYPARPFQGHLQPISRCRFHLLVKHVTIGMNRSTLLTAGPLRIITNSDSTRKETIAVLSRVGNSPRRAGQIRAAIESGSASQSLSGSVSRPCRSRHQTWQLQFCAVFDCDCDADTEGCSVEGSVSWSFQMTPGLRSFSEWHGQGL